LFKACKLESVTFTDKTERITRKWWFGCTGLGGTSELDNWGDESVHAEVIVGQG
jgi:hypothetical protein